LAGVSTTKLILASGSPRRAQILSEAGCELEIVTADVDEDGILAQGESLVESVQTLALAKASSVADTRSGKYVLGADTIVVMDDEVFGKPETADQAVEMLRRLNNRRHEVITGVAVINPAGETHTKHVSTSVMFRSLDEDAITDYVCSGSPFDKAGGYGIQDSSFAPVASYDGCYLNVVGLPMCATSELLKKSGFGELHAVKCAGHSAPGPGFGLGKRGSLQ
jgi:MAF protein